MSSRLAWRAGQCRLWDLSFEPEGGEGDARESGEALVHGVAGLPAGEELGVEPVEALDLEDGVGTPRQAAGDAFEQALRVVDEPGERGEVERDLVDAARAELLDRLDDRGVRLLL